MPATSPLFPSPGENQVDGFDKFRFPAVEPRLIPQRRGEIRRTDIERVQPLDFGDLLQVIERLAGLDHGEDDHCLVRMGVVVRTGIERRTDGPVTPPAQGWIAAGGNQELGILAAIDHWADDAIGPRVERLHPAAGVEPGDANQGDTVCRGDGLKHWYGSLVVHNAMLQIYGE